MLYSFVVVALLFLGLSRLLKIGEGTLEHGASYALYPFLLIQKKVSNKLSSWRFYRQSNEELAKHLERCSTLQEKLQQEVIELKSLINYRELTASQEDFLKRYATDRALIVQVLLKNFEKSHFFLIDAGEKKGITKDMIAVFKDCLLGRVVEVYPFYSKVVLITDPTCKVAAVCTSNNVKGIHEGMLNLKTTKLSFVSHLEEVKKDDLVISSGEGLIYPRGFGLGRVKEWERDGYTCCILLEPLIDFTKIEYCTLIQKGAELKEAVAPVAA